MKWLSWDMNLKVRLVGEGIFQLFFWMFFPFMSLHFSNSFGKDMAGLLLTIPPLLGIVASLLGGYAADYIGRRKTLLFAVAGQACAFALFVFSTSPWVDYLAFIVLAIFGSIYGPVAEAMVADLTNEEEQREVFALFYTTMNMGVVLGPMLGSFFYVHYRSELMLVCLLSLVMLFIAFYIYLRETLPATANRNHENSKAQLQKPKKNMFKDQWNNYSIIFRDKIFSKFILAGVLILMVFMQLDMYLSIYLEENIPMQTILSWGDWSFSMGGLTVFGWLISINGLLVVLFSTSVTRWFSSWSDRDALILANLLCGIGMFSFGLSYSFYFLALCMVIFTLGEMVRAPVALSFVSRYAPDDMRGQYMGAATLQFSVGRFLAPLIITISQWLPALVILAFLLFISIISSFLYAKLFRYVPEDPTQTEPAPVKPLEKADSL